MSIETVMTVIAVHGEGDRDKVNRLEHFNQRVQRGVGGQPVPEDLIPVPDVAPEVMLVLLDPDDRYRRVQFKLDTWEQVEEAKKLVGWDQEKSQWVFGKQIKISISEV